MDLYSTNDAILVRNCALVQTKILKFKQPNSNLSENTLREFNKLILLLNNSSLEDAKTLLNSSTTPEFKEFAETLKHTPAKDFANSHIELLKRFFRNAR